MSARFRPDRAGIGAFLRGPEMQAVMRIHAEAAMAKAVAAAPVDADSGHPGRYKGAFSVRSGDNGERAYAELVNTAPEAIWVEFGAHHHGKPTTPKRRLMLRSML